jgi:hypothetical protein
MTPGSQNGNMVDCCGTLAVVGAYGGSSVLLFDISAPLLPVHIGTADTGFQNGSISTDGSYVLTGEFEGSRVALLDISTPASPVLVSVTDLAGPGGLDTITNVALRMPNAGCWSRISPKPQKTEPRSRGPGQRPAFAVVGVSSPG